MKNSLSQNKHPTKRGKLVKSTLLSNKNENLNSRNIPRKVKRE